MFHFRTISETLVETFFSHGEPMGNSIQTEHKCEDPLCLHCYPVSREELAIERAKIEDRMLAQQQNPQAQLDMLRAQLNAGLLVLDRLAGILSGPADVDDGEALIA
jgi:hypothetical protein